MKIYFCGSITGGREDRGLYENLIQNLQQYGQVLTEHVAEEIIECEIGMSDKEIHDRDVSWLKQCDVVVAETTVTSTGVGYELGRAIERKLPTLCLFRENPGKSIPYNSVGIVLTPQALKFHWFNPKGLGSFHLTSYAKIILNSPMVAGAHNGNFFIVKNYTTEDEALTFIKDFMTSYKKNKT